MKPTTRLYAGLGSSLALVAGLVLALANCAGSGDPVENINAGYQALGSGDAEKALDHFAEALQVLDEKDPNYDRARMGEIEAKIRLKPDAAAQGFLAYAEKRPENVDAGDFQKIGMQLTERKALGEAVRVLGKGRELFPDDAKIDEALKKTKIAAESAGDAGALEALKGLGYT